MQNHTRPTRIVLVGDEVNDLVEGKSAAIANMLKAAPPFHYALCLVQNVSQLLLLSADQEFDVMFLTAKRWGSDALASLEKLLEAFSTIPIIVLAGDGTGAARHQALCAGAYTVLEYETLDAASLARTIQSAIGSNRDALQKEQQRVFEQALRFLQHNSAITRSRLTPQTLEMTPLSQVMPSKFLELTKSYSNVLDLALRRASGGIRFKSYSVSQQLNFLASDLGALRAGVWDVIDIHARAVEHKSVNKNETGDASHKILLELITDLVSYYRRSDYMNA